MVAPRVCDIPSREVRTPGYYWSITKFADIMAVDTNHKVFSSEAKLGGIAIQDMHSVEGALELEMFIAMDPPKHDQQRKAVTPAVAPSNLLLLEPTIRERACQILDDLPKIGRAHV